MKQRKTLIPVAVCFIALIFIGFLGRGVIRDQIVPIYAEIFYMPSVSKSFDKDFDLVNRELSTYGFTFNNTDTLNVSCWATEFSGLKESVHCHNGRDSDTMPVTDSFNQKWKSQSPSFEKKLLADGWLISLRNTEQPIQNIYDSVEGTTLVYQKHHGKVKCELTLGSEAFPYGSTVFSRDKEKTYIAEVCERTVGFFGGE